MADEPVSSKDVDSLQKEISEYDILKKIPLVVTYAAETLVKNRVPACARFLAKGLYGAALVGTSVFSVTVLPMVYVYRCSKRNEGMSPLCAE